MLMKIQRLKYLTIIFLAIFLLSCTKETEPDDQNENNQDPEKETWVLISKEKQYDSTINKFILTEEYPYPIALNFTTESEFCGHHDANLYEGSYSIDTTNNTISFYISFVTDVGYILLYWDYLEDLKELTHFEMIGKDTLKLSDQDTLTYILLRADYTELYDEYYPNFSCLTDTMIVENFLEGSTWIVWCKQIVKQQSTIESLFPPTEDEFPITLTLEGQDSLHGLHANNSYNGNFVREGTAIDLFNIASTEFEDNEWYEDYIEELSEMTSYNLNNDTLRMSNIDTSLSLYFLDKSFFNKNHFNIDSLYSN